MLQSLGSPEALLAMITESGGAGLAPDASRSKATRSARPSGSCASGSLDGFAPFREYCAWAAGLYSNIPQLFGMRTEVDQGSVRLRRRARVRVPHPLVPRRCQRPTAEYFEDAHPGPDRAPRGAAADRSAISSPTTISNTSSPRIVVVGRPHDLRAGVRARARSAAVAPTSTCTRPASATTRPSDSRPSSSPNAHDDDEHHLVVEVQSNRRRYGRLAAVNPNGRFFPQERIVLQVVRAPGRGRARLGRRARRRPPPGRDRPRPARPLELARRNRHHRRDGRAHRPRRPRGHRLRPRRGHPVRAERDHRPRRRHARLLASRRSRACASMDVPVAQMRARRRLRHTCGTATSAAHRDTLSRLMNEFGIGRGRDDPDRRSTAIPSASSSATSSTGPSGSATIPTSRTGCAASRARRRSRSATRACSRASATRRCTTRSPGCPNRTLILDRVEQMLARARRTRHRERGAVHRPRRFQAGQRHARARGRRPAAASRSRPGCSATLREGRHDRPPRRRRVRRARRRRIARPAVPSSSPSDCSKCCASRSRSTTPPAAGSASPRASASRSAPTSRATDLLRDADIALYEAKTAGRDRYVTFQTRDADRGRGSPHARARPPRRVRTRRVLPRVPADLRSRDRSRARRRGAVALEPPDARRRATRHVHPAARRDESDRRSRALGPRPRPAARPPNGTCRNATCTCRSTSRRASSTTNSSSTTSARALDGDRTRRRRRS